MNLIAQRTARLAALALIPLLSALPSQAATSTTTVRGQMGKTAQGCLQLLTNTVGGGENCMYDGGIPDSAVTPTGEVTGPFAQVHYYDSIATPGAFSTSFVPAPGSGQIRQVINGSVTIDDAGDGFGANDLVSFVLTLTSPGGGDIIRHLSSSVVDKYTSMTQTLAPVVVSSATPNALGGFDYVIGSEGFPTRLAFSSPGEPAAAACTGQLFGDMDCIVSFDSAINDPDRWLGSSSAGLGSLENSIGARTVGDIANPACVGTDGSSGGNDCTDSKVSFAPREIGPNLAPGTNGITAEDVGWDQLLLKVSTDASGQVVSLSGFDVQEYLVFGPNTRCGSDPGATPAAPCNSWLSGYFDATGVVANDDGPINSPPTVVTDVDVLANDTNFEDPVTVTITSQPTKGQAQVLVNGVPGNQGTQASIRIRYTADAGSVDSDTLVYQVTDGVSTDTATVTLAITVNSLSPDARPGTISISTKGQAPLALSGVFDAPGSGGSLGNLPALIAVTAPGTRGSTALTETTKITYTITDAGFFAGTDTFTYTITDDDGEVSSADVTVSIADEQPAIAIWGIDADQGQPSAEYSVASFIDLGNGAAGQHPVTISEQAAQGECSVSPANATGKLVYVPVAGYSGADSCEITVADGDGDTAVSTVNITVNPASTVRPEVGGASSLDLWVLLLLAGAALRRRGHNAGAHRDADDRTPLQRLLPAVLLAFISATAMAQDAEPGPEPEPEEDSLAIQEIVVTARKVEENLKEVPLAITAFDSAAIEAAGINSLNDVAELTPGLSFFNPAGEALPTPVIRGVVPTDIFGDNNAAVFVDGVFVSGREGLNFSQLDVERIEVVKGPQSALYGRNAFSGAINYVTKRPSDVFEGKTSVEVGNEGKQKGVVMFTGPVWGEKLLGRVSALYDEWDGSYDNSLSDVDVGGYRYRSLQGRLDWLATDDLEFSLAYYKSNDDIDGAPQVGLLANCEDKVEAPPGTTDYPVQAGARYLNYCGQLPDLDSVPGISQDGTIPRVAEATGENRDLDRASLKIDWNLQDRGSITSLTGYSKTQQNDINDFSRHLGNSQSFLYCSPATLENPQTPNSCTDGGTPTPANQRFFTGIYDVEPGPETEEWSQELRFTSPQDQRLRFTAGAYWFDVSLDDREGNPVANRPLPTAAIGLPPFDPSAPDLAIGTAIFYGTFADDPFTPGFRADGGLDPYSRVFEDRDTEGWALFTGADFDLTDQLTLRGELRYSQESQNTQLNAYELCDQKGYAIEDPLNPGQFIPNPCGDDLYDLRVTGVLPVCVPGQDITDASDELLCSVTGSTRFDTWTGRIGLDYQWTDDWMVYGSIARGEKPGGLRLYAESLAAGGSAVIDNPFDPEQITAYELGAKGYLFDRRISLDLALFYNDWKDIVLRQLIETVPSSGERLEQPLGVNVNAGDATVMGAEASASFSITENLSGSAGVGYVHAELDNARQDTYARYPTFRADCGTPPGTPDGNKAWYEACDKLSGDVSGNTLLRQPEWKWSASLSYRRPFSAEWDWYARGDATYTSDVYVGNENESWVPAHTYVNTKLGIESSRYTVELWVRNLFEDDSATAAYRDIFFANTDNLYEPYVDQGPRPNFDQFVPFRYSVTYPRLRTWGISATMRFGEKYE